MGKCQPPSDARYKDAFPGEGDHTLTLLHHQQHGGKGTRLGMAQELLIPLGSRDFETWGVLYKCNATVRPHLSPTAEGRGECNASKRWEQNFGQAAGGWIQGFGTRKIMSTSS